jgi:AcrR family transcriptional regulator
MAEAASKGSKTQRTRVNRATVVASKTSRTKPQDGSARKPRSRERYNERRAEVVDIAARVFAERGYHATSIDDLVEATGLKRGGLYHYIDGKHSLLTAIHERFIDPLLAESEEIVARGEPPEDTLRLLAFALMRDIATFNNQVTVFLHEWRVIENDPEWRDIRRSRKKFESLIESVLKAGEEEGAFSVRDRKITLLAFLGMLNYSYQWYHTGGRAPYEKIAAEFCDIFLNGIRAH